MQVIGALLVSILSFHGTGRDALNNTVRHSACPTFGRIAHQPIIRGANVRKFWTPGMQTAATSSIIQNFLLIVLCIGGGGRQVEGAFVLECICVTCLCCTSHLASYILILIMRKILTIFVNVFDLIVFFSFRILLLDTFFCLIYILGNIEAEFFFFFFIGCRVLENGSRKHTPDALKNPSTRLQRQGWLCHI